MRTTENNDAVQRNDIIKGNMVYFPDGGGMGKEDRKNQVLRLLNESDLALTPYVIFRNLRMRGATFERRTLGNYIRELVEEEKIEKLNQGGDPLYRITETGRESIK